MPVTLALVRSRYKNSRDSLSANLARISSSGSMRDPDSDKQKDGRRAMNEDVRDQALASVWEHTVDMPA